MEGSLYVPLDKILSLARSHAVAVPPARVVEPSVVEVPKVDPISIRPALTYACGRAAKTNAWSNDQMFRLRRGLYRALYCKTLCSNDLSLSMPYRIDACWHELILNTDDYALVCKTLNRSLKHTTRSEADSVEVKNARVNTLAIIYRQVYKEEPDAWCWELESAPAVLKAGRKRKQEEPKEGWTSFSLHGKTLSGKTIVMHVTPGMHIDTLKALVREAEGYPLDQQRLVYAGEALVDDKVVSDYKLCNESTIHVLIKLRGC